MKFKSASDIQKFILEKGFLPFFVNTIDGFSIEEMIADRYWFPADRDGVWEWKGPIIQSGGIAYGKFFKKKALYVSLDFYPDLINYRRSMYPLNDNEKDFLACLKEEGSLISREWRALMGLGGKENVSVDLMTGPVHRKKKSGEKGKGSLRQTFDSTVASLQMAGYVLIEDFEYAHDKKGNPYGWGLARYTTPELFFGEDNLVTSRTAQESYDYLFNHLQSICPKADEKSLKTLLG